MPITIKWKNPPNVKDIKLYWSKTKITDTTELSPITPAITATQYEITDNKLNTIWVRLLITKTDNTVIDSGIKTINNNNLVESASGVTSDIYHTLFKRDTAINFFGDHHHKAIQGFNVKNEVSYKKMMHHGKVIYISTDTALSGLTSINALLQSGLIYPQHSISRNAMKSAGYKVGYEFTHNGRKYRMRLPYCQPYSFKLADSVLLNTNNPYRPDNEVLELYIYNTLKFTDVNHLRIFKTNIETFKPFIFTFNDTKYTAVNDNIPVSVFTGNTTHVACMSSLNTFTNQRPTLVNTNLDKLNFRLVVEDIGSA